MWFMGSFVRSPFHPAYERAGTDHGLVTRPQLRVIAVLGWEQFEAANDRLDTRTKSGKERQGRIWIIVSLSVLKSNETSSMEPRN